MRHTYTTEDGEEWFEMTVTTVLGYVLVHFLGDRTVFYFMRPDGVELSIARRPCSRQFAVTYANRFIHEFYDWKGEKDDTSRSD